MLSSDTPIQQQAQNEDSTFWLRAAKYLLSVSINHTEMYAALHPSIHSLTRDTRAINEPELDLNSTSRILELPRSRPEIMHTCTTVYTLPERGSSRTWQRPTKRRRSKTFFHLPKCLHVQVLLQPTCTSFYSMRRHATTCHAILFSLDEIPTRLGTTLNPSTGNNLSDWLAGRLAVLGRALLALRPPRCVQCYALPLFLFCWWNDWETLEVIHRNAAQKDRLPYNERMM